MQQKITVPTSPYYYGSYLFKVISVFEFSVLKNSKVCVHTLICVDRHTYIFISIYRKENIKQV